MLILRRRVGEKILVGGSVEIEIVEISKSRVKLGVRAPLHVPVVRKELATVAGENRTALELVAGEGVGSLLSRLNESRLNEIQRRPI
ncbi:MAG TPA: carbon storage regulator [Bryobacteraceae bacterium]|nr:carbon storage regulator [Bryobacteraceae bacterium]